VFAQEALARFGKIDVIVNNAGVMPLSPMAALKVDEWDRMVDVNIKGTLYGIAAVLPAMNEQGFGQLINIAYRCSCRIAHRSGLLRHQICGPRHFGRAAPGE
jgi:NADP-dependent 3-hydroxy acid dehydrogenase YdfG